MAAGGRRRGALAQNTEPRFKASLVRLSSEGRAGERQGGGGGTERSNKREAQSDRTDSVRNVNTAERERETDRERERERGRERERERANRR